MRTDVNARQRRLGVTGSERMLVGGDWVQATGQRSFEDRDPATGDLLATLPDATAADVDDAVGRATEAFAGWSATDAAERGRVLMALADRIEGAQEHFSQIEAADNGRPRRETGAQAGIIAKWFRYFGGMADKIQGETIPVAGPYLNYTKRVPVGVCGAITPWNHPALIAVKKIAPAIACGNTVVVKPSELAPLSVLELGRLALEAGVPPGVLNIVTGQREAGEALVAHPGVARIDLTGSTPTGVAVAKGAADTLKRLGLELGGKAANLVFDDIDLERAVRGAVFSAFVGQGQSCVAGSRILVQRSIADEFTTRLAEHVAAIRPGDPLDPGTRMGPLITPAAAARIAGFVRDAVADGATVVTGGAVPDDLADGLSPDGFYLPTVLWSEDAAIRAAREEVFGPVTAVIPFDTEHEAIAIANSLPFGLGAGVWTGDVNRAHRVADALRAGIVYVNDYHRIDPASPWGGFGMSGYGRENGYEAVRMFTEVKSVWVGLEDRMVDWYGSDAPTRLN
jgi:acyl-CoA reductase-like NAD-dependent aldehyde dehydrogenase